MRVTQIGTALLLAVATGCATQTPPATQVAATAGAPIDRHAVVSRHDFVVDAADPFGALAVGNGDFAFNFDITGLQIFPDYYAKTTPLGTLSTWGWHSFPNSEGFTPATYPLKMIPKNGRTFSCPAACTVHPTTQATLTASAWGRSGWR